LAQRAVFVHGVERFGKRLSGAIVRLELVFIDPRKKLLAYARNGLFDESIPSSGRY
jgi:hypothetical protein